MNEFFKPISGEGRYYLCFFGMIFGSLALLITGVTIYSTITEVYNPNPYKWDRRAEPTTKVQPLPG